MVRPIVLMAEVEPPEGLSARKLVLETGKFNVITAYSVEEALETLVAFSPGSRSGSARLGLPADGLR